MQLSCEFLLISSNVSLSVHTPHSGSMNQFIAVYNSNGDIISNIKYYDGFMGQRIGAISCLAFHPYWVLQPLLSSHSPVLGTAVFTHLTLTCTGYCNLFTHSHSPIQGTAAFPLLTLTCTGYCNLYTHSHSPVLGTATFTLLTLTCTGYCNHYTPDTHLFWVLQPLHSSHSPALGTATFTLLTLTSTGYCNLFTQSHSPVLGTAPFPLLTLTCTGHCSL